MDVDRRYEVYKLNPDKQNEVIELFQKILVTGEAHRQLPLRVTSSLIESLGARCAVLQRNVQDPDFLAEHTAYYSQWSYRVPRYCNRVHFFSEDPTSENALDVIDAMAEKQDAYIGFVTLRPIKTSPVGATILRMPNVDGQSHFILSKDEFPVHLAGHTFRVSGTPFIQQDNAVGACAQASIWMALRTLRRREGQVAYSPAQITTAATRFLVRGRTLPNRDGLHFEQLTEALRTAGYAPHTIPLIKRDEPPKPVTQDLLDRAKLQLYPYVESGIPVLITLFPPGQPGHAVLLIGHGWNANPPHLVKHGELQHPCWEEGLQVFDAISWIEPFYIHNDNTGPYLPLRETDANDYCLAHATLALPFLQQDVFIDGAEARETCLELFVNILQNLNKDRDPNQKYRLPNIVVRIYLQERADFRTTVLESKMPPEVKAYYRTKWLPKRIWIMEINAIDGYADCPSGNATRLGEILLDPSSEPEDAHFLTIHLNSELLPPEASKIGGVIIDRDAFNGATKAYPVPATAYSPLVRNSKNT